MRRFFTLLVLATALACGGDSSTSPSDTVSGTYTLRTVNGAPLPFLVIQIGSDKYEIVTDAFTLTDNGTWTEAGTDRSTENGQVTTGTITDSGTYTVNGTAITLVSTQNGSINGSVGGGKLTLTAEGLVAVYQK